jgi:histidinol phosphatase-like enzyme|tara:strand:+ start:227 stop:568 length:342 start_codon:yes stop_codon:yes gene_type:complete
MKKICFDLDGVICTTINADYRKSQPKKEIINLINKLYKKYYILIFTARYMGRSKENVKLAKKKGYKFTLKQLQDWNLKFHELKFGKPSYDIIVDDKSFDFKKNWHKKFKKIIK